MKLLNDNTDSNGKHVDSYECCECGRVMGPWVKFDGSRMEPILCIDCLRFYQIHGRLQAVKEYLKGADLGDGDGEIQGKRNQKARRTTR